MKCVGGLLLLLLFNFGILCYGYNSNRIINGVPAPQDKYHNVVLIHQMKFFWNDDNIIPKEFFPDIFKFNPNVEIGVCTGTLISKRHILTAAHCVSQMVLSPQRTRMITTYEGFFVGFPPVHDISKDIINFKKFGFSIEPLYHDTWSHELYKDDIAIIRLPVEITDIEPVKLAKNYVETPNDIATNVGYGDIDPDAEKEVSPKTLMEIDLQILKECIQSKEYNVICAGNSTHRSDHGDSGGPLFVKSDDGNLYQIGVANAYALKNGSTLQPTDIPDYVAYMRISAYCDWFENVTRGEAKCVDIAGKIVTPSPILPPAPPPAPNPTPAPAPVPNIPTERPAQQETSSSVTPNNATDSTQAIPNAPTAAPLVQQTGNGGMSKNIFGILFAAIFAFVINAI